MRPLRIAAAVFAAFLGTMTFGHAGLETKPAVVGAYYKAVMRIPHGCDGAATDTVRVRIPEGMIWVKPKPKPNWDVEAVMGAYQNTYDLYGRAVTEGVDELIWRGSLPNDQFDEFVFLGKVSDSVPVDAPLHFYTIQHCKAARIHWIEVPDVGQDRHDLKRPVPILNIEPKGHDNHCLVLPRRPLALWA